MSKTILGIMAACFSAILGQSSAAASTVVYALSFTGTGQYEVLAPTVGTPQALPSGIYTLDVVGHSPVIDVPGFADIVRVDGVSISGPPGSALVPVGATAALAIYQGALSGSAAFGNYSGGTFSAAVTFIGGADLAAYDGLSRFVDPSVTVTQFNGLQVDTAHEQIGIQFDTYANASFSAVVPEPATWALMMAGVGAVGFALRRSKSIAAA